ncbi:ubiquinone/menaquinone biosynthesis C-methylase UbiE [Laceyella sacchari]|jgi:ubiquinone/menaquinone biosynthesis C-methylase UbiE|uniref:class I SAM-dependent methyltransferase n=1 Tax=Laceyella sacchari TaxID=37482 RepID=UPI0003B4C9EA|nr:class I SAM-dependent methyltransferase [Laceyella sacchari]TCW41705.1 ubiquinone/menaquinone biosynthesis C-methylase UbiE [Laceyella sacchari]
MKSNNFDSIAHLYDETRQYPEFVYENIFKLIEALGQLDSKEAKICEVGVGTGRMAIPFIKKGYAYTGIDISNNMLSKFKDKIANIDHINQVEVFQADATHLPFENSRFDMVWGTKVLRHISNWKGVLQEAKRVLKENGVFLHGEEYWVVAPPTVKVRRQWEKFIFEQNERPNRPFGVTDDHEIAKYLEEIGGKSRILTLSTWPVHETFLQKIEHFATRAGSSTFGISDEALENSVEKLKQWAYHEYGNLNYPYSGIRGFRVVMGTFDS